MNLEKVTNKEKLELCQKYYYGGFACLPFLWAVNVIWFAKEAFVKQPYEEQQRIRTCVIRSAIGATISFAGLMTWVIIFQLNRASWGATADQISFIIPQGIPWATSPLWKLRYQTCTHLQLLIVITYVTLSALNRILNYSDNVHIFSYLYPSNEFGWSPQKKNTTKLYVLLSNRPVCLGLIPYLRFFLLFFAKQDRTWIN